MNLLIRDGALADGGGIAAIYNHYIRHTIVTFEEETVDSAEMSRRVASVQDAGLPWLVAEDADDIVGYAYATGWRTRVAYRHCAEVSVYLRHDRAGRGLGTALYAELFARMAQTPIHVLLGCISLPNEASVALHEKFGLRKVAHFDEVGYKFGRWIDVGYWQKTVPASTDTGGTAAGSR